MKSDRLYFNGTLPVTTSAPTAGIEYRGSAQGMLYIPATASLTTITWYTSADGITWYASTDTPTTTVTSAATSIQIPIALMGAGFIGVKANVAFTAGWSVKS